MPLTISPIHALGPDTWVWRRYDVRDIWVKNGSVVDSRWVRRRVIADEMTLFGVIVLFGLIDGGRKGDGRTIRRGPVRLGMLFSPYTLH